MLRILLADDHEVLRRGLCQIIEEQPGWTVCGQATDGREAVELAIRHHPDIVVLDVSMPELNGLESTRQIKKALPQTEILIFTMHKSEKLLRDVLAAGARSFVLKSDGPQSIVAALSALARHKPFITPDVAETILEGFLRQSPGTNETVSLAITPREREILQMLAEGQSNKKIATALGLSVKTVETHRAAIMRKTGASTIVDVVRYAMRNGIVQL